MRAERPGLAAAVAGVPLSTPEAAPALLQSGAPGWIAAALVGLLLGLLVMAALRRRGPVSIEGPAERGPHARALPIVGLFSGTTLLVVAASLLGSHRETLARTEQTADHFARIVGQRVDGDLDALDLALTLAGRAARAERAPGAVPVDTLMAATLEQLPFVREIRIAGPDGRVRRVLGRSGARATAATVKAAQVGAGHGGTGADGGLSIGRPVRRPDGTWSLPVSRRIEDPRGRLTGVVTALLDPSYLARARHSLELGRDGFVAFAVTRSSAAATRGAGTRTDDDIDRVVGARRVGDRDLVVLVGLGLRESLAGWYRTASAQAAGALALLALAALLGQHLLRDLARGPTATPAHVANRERLEFLALYDPLTGLPNRALFIDRMRQRLETAPADGTLLAVARLDIARFRQINDSVGWEAGDELLRSIARRLEQALGTEGLVARTERDHFAIALSGGRSASELGLRAGQLLHDCFDLPYLIAQRELHVGTRLGIAVHPGDGRDVETLLRNADAALRKSRDAAETIVFYAPAMNARVAESLAIENRLRTALERQQFVLHYQPKFDARSGELAGLEGLIRWNDPEAGLMPPGHFIAILEKTGLILDVGHWAMERAVEDYRRWQEGGLVPPRIAINVSALQLHEAAFADRVRDALGDTAGEHAGLELEITESMLMSGVEASAEKLGAVRELGVRIAIDDFGTGYSSLQYIARLPLDTLKIDRSFVVGMTENATDREIVASVISLAHQLKLNVVAEGVEADDQARMLRSLDCDEMQGFLFSPPLPAEQIERLMRGARRAPSIALH